MVPHVLQIIRRKVMGAHVLPVLQETIAILVISYIKNIFPFSNSQFYILLKISAIDLLIVSMSEWWYMHDHL